MNDYPRPYPYSAYSVPSLPPHAYPYGVNVAPPFLPPGSYPGITPYPSRFASWGELPLQDYGQQPLVLNINRAAKQNETFRTALWTGKHFQVTLMSIPVGEDIGLEVHPHTDQFVRIEEGQGVTQMGDTPEKLDFVQNVHDDDAVFVPAGKWHNITNTGTVPLKVYVIYAPPQHPFGTVHQTKKDAMEEERV
ncbi:cupin domain-containing protein [Paenibacillus sp. DXFW5]|uniref:Cupin domain-containing protein n=1 Tax=Paenibacillus rhizolycopersici TaxID=2780073 RepID=A0ABS2H3W1_9BACL|nr:cupin domain-containing protein [Paenibacillus rhizolycopersici]MBM6994521.1 cupin domain-containing protein [Paenibacillus rhizolycopersici]